MPMRNLRSIRRLVGRHLEHDPATVDVREDRCDVINTKYLDLNDSEDWTFLQVEEDFLVYQARDNTLTSATAALTNASTTVTFSTSLGTAFTNQAGGWTLTGPDGEDYTVIRFTSTTVAVISPPYAGSTVAASTSWTIATDRYYLPVDCARALGFIDRENGQGRLTILDRRREEQYLSWQSSTGTVYFLVDGDTLTDRAPDPGWTAASSATVGTLTATATYEVCYAFDYEGRESPPSVPVRVTIATGQTSIAVAGMESNTLGSGIYKNVYLRQLTSGPTLPAQEVYGRWLRVGQMTTETATTLSITALPANSSATLVYCSGRKTMRPKFVPGADATLRLRYLAKPARLVADSDVPYKWPEAFHDLLAYGAAIDIGLSQGAASGKIDRWQKEYDRLYARMKSTQIQVADAPAVKSMRTDMGPGGPAPYLTNGIPVGDYYGG